ncbi:MAG: hypothetical protein Q8Q80_08450 [Methyloversatilis sp.]|uniref:hypothetical protein n=1 Tax=Methyloversatilis sp. TaxID=2569862 RepID=UPI0027327D80|nr:hypothetical protein [Methyloversatilis sp.]MDP3872679.1 hypothetical protein [Methyloversatilis sp.]
MNGIRRTWLPFALGATPWITLALLLVFELVLHSDAWVLRYRSVFAVGRASDKVDFLARQRPEVLFVGNSRADNGLSPEAFTAGAGLIKPAGVFNLGVPGANTLVLKGVVERLLDEGMAAPAHVFITLDETLFQHEDSLGYYGFLASRSDMLEHGFYGALFGSWLRTWYYSGNLRQLREPEKLLRFVSATFSNIDPIGGSAEQSRGYRRGISGGFQTRAQLIAQEAGTRAPPDPRMANALGALVERLVSSGSRVYLVAVPMFERASSFGPAAAPSEYSKVLSLLEARGARWLEVPLAKRLGPEHFADPGHLNDGGAVLFSSALGGAWQKLADKR